MKLQRSHAIWYALAAVLACTWYASGLDDDAPTDAGRSTRPAAARGTGTTAKTAKTAADLQKQRARDQATLAQAFTPRVAMAALDEDPFAAKNFAPPPPPPPPPQAAAAPVAPPLAFKYLGALREDGPPAVFLDHGGQMLIARKGDTLAGNYRVLDIAEGSMLLEYLPLAQQQTLFFGR